MMASANTPEADIVDVQFGLSGMSVPADHADMLLSAIEGVLPWLVDEPSFGLHPLTGLSPGGGQGWYLSRRSRLVLRLPRPRAEDALRSLAGTRLALAESRVEVGAGVLREIAFSPVIYSKFVAFSPVSEEGGQACEEAFLGGLREALAALDIRPQMICGKARQARTPAGWLGGFSLLLAGLENAMNLHLQRHGLGIERRRGCGIFVPHKTFSAVTLE